MVDSTGSALIRIRPQPPWPGGEPGAPGENWLLPGGDESEAERLPDKCTIHVQAGDVIRVLAWRRRVGDAALLGP